MGVGNWKGLEVIGIRKGGLELEGGGSYRDVKNAFAWVTV